MRRFNANKKRVLRELLNLHRPTPFNTVRGFNKLFSTNTNQTYNILDDLVGVVVLPEPNMDLLRQLLFRNRGNSIRVSYLIDGESVLRHNNMPIDRDITIPNFANNVEFADWFAGERWRWVVDTETDIFQSFEHQGKLYSRPVTSLATTNRIVQSFLDGLSHCVFEPILNWCNGCLLNAESDSAKKKYKGKINNITKLSKKYEEGVPENDIEEVCKKLNVKICVSYPFCDYEQNYGDKLIHPDKVFKFINTRINHLELGNLVINKKPETVSRDFIYSKINELDENKEFYYTTKDNRGYNSISTLNDSWSCSTEYRDTLLEFENENGLNKMKICDIKNQELASFIKRGTHYNTSFGSISGCSDKNYDYETIENIKLIDQKKAYYNFNKCKYYEGFLGKITDFRETNKIMGVGLYLIKNIEFPDNSLNKLNDRMKWFKSNNIYTSAELKVLDNYDVSYKIVAGCWGIETLHFEFGEEFLKKTDKTPFVNEKGELTMKGISYYAKTTGLWDNHTTHSYKFMKGNNEYAQILRNSTDNVIVKCEGEDEICIGIKKKSILSLGHITAFILAYQRISLMEQLLEMDIDKVLGVYVDGIYYKEHVFNTLDTFESKIIDSYVAFRSEGFLTNIFEKKPNIKYAPFRENYKTELFIGAGGNGKTHYNLTDEGLINILYVAPTHKLNANKKGDYNVNVEVLASLTNNNPINYERVMNYNIIVFDEVSMMSNEEKILLINKFNKLKLIFCGDVGFQLPCISTINEQKTEFIIEGFQNITEFTTNYRCKDTKFLEILNAVRKRIKEGYNTISKEIQDLFTEYDTDYVKNNYRCKDMIICGTNKAKDLYTEFFSDKKKWSITKNTKYYNNGDIIIQEEQPDKSAVIRHAYTAHSIQGETSYFKLFIDKGTLTDIKTFYTAISRARKMNQIFMINRPIVVGEDKENIIKKSTGKCNDCGEKCGNYYRCQGCHFEWKGISYGQSHLNDFI